MLRRLLLPTAVALTFTALPSSALAARYRVQWGDSLTSIAARYGTSVHRLAAANRLNPLGTLLAGTTLRIPSARPSTYRVRPGDTLSGLAARFRTTIAALAAANRLDPAGYLFAGAVIRLPGSAAPAQVDVLKVVPAATASYRVRLGDSLSAIAARFGTTVSALAAANRLDPAGVLLAESTITVPRGRPAPAVVEARQPVSHGEVRSLVVFWAQRYGVDLRLALALSWMESGYQASVVSSAGAFGPMQVTPATRDFVEAVLVGSPIAHTTSGDVQVGVAYLHYLLGRFGGDERLALAGYFQGPEGVRRGLLPSTRVYIANVLALKSRV
jgi:LysM repeat protein